MTTNTTSPDFAALTAHAETCIRGSYQRALLYGQARWSGGDLQGKAARWSGVYSRSRDTLMRRLGAGWSTDLVFDPGSSRFTRRLLVAHDGRRYDWITEMPLTTDAAGRLSL